MKNIKRMNLIQGYDFLAPGSTAASPLTVINGIKDYYSTLIQQVCGVSTLGDFVAYFSNKPVEFIEATLQQCCRNQRAGIVLKGRMVSLFSIPTMQQLLSLLQFSQAHPEYFAAFITADLQHLVFNPKKPNFQGQTMVPGAASPLTFTLPAKMTNFLRGDACILSPPSILKYVGTYFHRQIHQYCGATLGEVVQFFSGKYLDDIKTTLYQCCKNERAGTTLEYKGTNITVAEINIQALESLIELLCFAQKHPKLFKDCNIVPSESELRGLMDEPRSMLKKLQQIACPNCKDWPDARGGLLHYDGYCGTCFKHLFPEDERSVPTARGTKEQKVRHFINQYFEGFVHDTALYTGSCDCTHRRRIDHRHLYGNTLLAIETDEGQHSGYSAKSEEIRYDDLFMIHSGKWIWIRFNPDGPMLEQKLEVLKTTIQGCIDRIARDENTELIEIIHLFYNEPATKKRKIDREAEKAAEKIRVAAEKAAAKERKEEEKEANRIRAAAKKAADRKSQAEAKKVTNLLQRMAEFQGRFPPLPNVPTLPSLPLPEF